MSLQVRISIACALGRARLRDGLPEPLCDPDSFSALPAVGLWMAELRTMVRWRSDVNVEELVERLRLDAAEWPVFDWKSPHAYENGSSQEVIRVGVAHREAKLATERRVQQ
jgi:hypothetical protein